MDSAEYKEQVFDYLLLEIRLGVKRHWTWDDFFQEAATLAHYIFRKGRDNIDFAKIRGS